MAKKKGRVTKKRENTGAKISKEREKEEMERAQVWSVDVLLAVVIFISVILIFYVTMTAKQKPGLKDLEAEATELKIELEQHNELGFINADEVNETRFDVFIYNATTNYDGLKQKLGVTAEFCIFYEDADGNIILIVGNKTSIGSPDIFINGSPCGTQIS